MAQPDLTHIPLDQLSVSKLNMRHGRKKPDVSDILPSIREKGIRQTLLVRREGDGYGVIAGRRRYFALLELAKESGTNPLVPCAVMPEEDAASAIEASIIENVARLPATEMEQYVAFRKLADEGKAPEDIATFFGVTELLVRRVLALAGLAAPIRKLYAEDEIDGETIRALTLATPAQRAEWLKLWISETERAPFGRACKAWVTGGSTITTDKALFELERYEGAITSDLFGERAVFADAEAFWTAQAAEVSTRIEQYLARGWTDVVCLERGAYFQRWEYVQTTKQKGGKVYVEQRHDGTVTFHEGWLKASEARRTKRQTADGAASAPADTKPEMSGPMAEYILIKPTQAGLKTNLIITTSLRAYHLELRAFEETYMAAVSWRYADQQLVTRVANSGTARATASSSPAGLQLDRLKFRYDIDGDAPHWRPTQVFDDGRKVYIRFPARLDQGEAPALFVIGRDGKSQLVNYRMSGDYYVVDRLFARAELRLGEKRQDVVKIARNDLESTKP